jgi:hypothetical protein
MADPRPICKIDMEPDGSISFETLSNLPNECRIPPGLRSVDIPIDIEGDEAATSANTGNSVRKGSIQTNAATMGEPALDSATAVSTTNKTSVLVPSSPSTPRPDAQDMSPALVMGLAAAGSVASSLVTKLAQNILKNSTNSKKNGRKDSSNEPEQKEEESHKNCSVERMSLQQKISGLERRIDSLNDSIDDFSDKLLEIKSKISERRKNVSEPFDPEEFEERLEALETSVKKKKRN